MTVLEKNGAYLASEPVAVGGLSSHLVPPRRGVTEDSGLRPFDSPSLLRLAIFRVVSEANQFDSLPSRQLNEKAGKFAHILGRNLAEFLTSEPCKSM